MNKKARDFSPRSVSSAFAALFCAIAPFSSTAFATGDPGKNWMVICNAAGECTAQSLASGKAGLGVTFAQDGSATGFALRLPPEDFDLAKGLTLKPGEGTALSLNDFDLAQTPGSGDLYTVLNPLIRARLAAALAQSDFVTIEAEAEAGPVSLSVPVGGLKASVDVARAEGGPQIAREESEARAVETLAERRSDEPVEAPSRQAQPQVSDLVKTDVAEAVSPEAEEVATAGEAQGIGGPNVLNREALDTASPRPIVDNFVQASLTSIRPRPKPDLGDQSPRRGPVISPNALPSAAGEALIGRCEAYGLNLIQEREGDVEGVTLFDNKAAQRQPYPAVIGRQPIQTLVRGHGLVKREVFGAEEISFICLFSENNQRPVFFHYEPRENVAPLERCWRDAQTRTDLQPCLERLQSVATAALTAERIKADEAVQTLPEARQQQEAQDWLAQSQAAWEAYRDAECSRRQRLVSPSSGTGDIQQACRVELTFSRAQELSRD